MLSMVARHFSSSAFSLQITRSFDAARILTMACIATVADAVVCHVMHIVPIHWALRSRLASFASNRFVW
jgi:hypothetical protein